MFQNWCPFSCFLCPDYPVHFLHLFHIFAELILAIKQKYKKTSFREVVTACKDVLQLPIQKVLIFRQITCKAVDEYTWYTASVLDITSLSQGSASFCIISLHVYLKECQSFYIQTACQLAAMKDCLNTSQQLLQIRNIPLFFHMLPFTKNKK